MNNLLKVLKESLQSVLPIFAIVLLLSITFAPLESGVLVMFLFGTLLLIAGMQAQRINDVSILPKHFLQPERPPVASHKQQFPNQKNRLPPMHFHCILCGRRWCVRF